MMKIEPSEMFKVLGVETRIKIIDLLKSRGPLGALKIAEMLAITPAAVSQHLKVLRQAGLIRSERKGYWIPYSVDEEALECCREALSEVCTCECRENGTSRKHIPEESDLESLKKYESKLQRELAVIRDRIREIESRKK